MYYNVKLADQIILELQQTFFNELSSGYYVLMCSVRHQLNHHFTERNRTFWSHLVPSKYEAKKTDLRLHILIIFSVGLNVKLNVI